MRPPLEHSLPLRTYSPTYAQCLCISDLCNRYRVFPPGHRLLGSHAEPDLCFDTIVISLIRNIPQTQANSNQRWTGRAFTRYVASKERTRSGGYLALSRLYLRAYEKHTSGIIVENAQRDTNNNDATYNNITISRYSRNAERMLSHFIILSNRMSTGGDQEDGTSTCTRQVKKYTQKSKRMALL